jgi:hypothetical protein
LVDQNPSPQFRYLHGQTLVTGSAKIASGVVGFAGLTGYLNGNPDGTMASGASPIMYPVFINGYNNGAGVDTSASIVTIQAFWICNITASGEQMAAVSTAMAAL